MFLNTAGGLFSLKNDAGNAAVDSGIITYNGETFCYEDQYFDRNVANVICRSLGYDIATSWVTVESDNYSAPVSKFKCGREEWSSCTYSQDTVCGTSRAVRMTCQCELTFVHL